MVQILDASGPWSQVRHDNPLQLGLDLCQVVSFYVVINHDGLRSSPKTKSLRRLNTVVSVGFECLFHTSRDIRRYPVDSYLSVSGIYLVIGSSSLWVPCVAKLQVHW